MQGRARPLGVVEEGLKSRTAPASVRVCARHFPPLCPPPLLDSFSLLGFLFCVFFFYSWSLFHDIRLSTPLSAAVSFYLPPSLPPPCIPRLHPTSPPSSSDHSPPLAALFTHTPVVTCLWLPAAWSHSGQASGTGSGRSGGAGRFHEEALALASCRTRRSRDVAQEPGHTLSRPQV